MIFMGAGRQECRPDKERTHLIPQAHMLHFIESGHGYFNGRLLGAGEGFVCRNDRVCDYRPLPEDPWTYSWINVFGPDADALVSRLPLTDDAFSFDPAQGLPLLKELDPDNDLLCLGVLYRLCADLTHGVKDGYVERAKKLMQVGFEKGVTVADVARALNLSRAYLRNVFFRETGLSPQEYLMNLKMKRAEALLSFPYTVTEIAGACGYTDVMQFSKVFRRYHGQSPSEYRKSR